MPVSEVRYHLAQVIEASRAGWRAFCRRHGSNPTALAEVIGLYLATVKDPPPPWLRRLVAEAIELEDERRQRKP